MNINETALTESVALREQYTDTSVLDRFGPVPEVSGTGLMTAEMVATFYDVDKETITTTVQRNKYELKKLGMEVIKGEDLKNFKRNHPGIIDSRTSQLTLYSRECVMFIGLRLRNSEVANKLQESVGSFYIPYKEARTLLPLRRALRHLNPVPQHSVGPYRIDLYFPTLKVAVECDELGHRDRCPKEERDRQQFIENELECIFIRYDPDSPEFDIYEVINQVLTQGQQTV